MRLEDFIRYRSADLDESFGALSDRARRAGYDISKSVMHKWAAYPSENLPRTDTIHGLAAALRVQSHQILAAAAESAGVAMPNVGDLSGWTDEELLDELRLRLRRAEPWFDYDQRRPAPPQHTQDDHALAAFTEPYTDDDEADDDEAG